MEQITAIVQHKRGNFQWKKLCEPCLILYFQMNNNNSDAVAEITPCHHCASFVLYFLSLSISLHVYLLTCWFKCLNWPKPDCDAHTAPVKRKNDTLQKIDMREKNPLVVVKDDVF